MISLYPRKRSTALEHSLTVLGVALVIVAVTYAAFKVLLP